MALSVKNPEADRLARELSAATGESLTQAVVTALRERLDRIQRSRAPMITRRLQALKDELRTYPVVDSRSPDEIVGYDEHGLPT
jgi:antitoxin VapB